MSRDRFSIDLGGRLNDTIEQIAREEGLTKAEVIRRGLAFYAAVRTHVDAKEDQVVIRHKSGDERQVLVI